MAKGYTEGKRKMRGVWSGVDQKVMSAPTNDRLDSTRGVPWISWVNHPGRTDPRRSWRSKRRCVVN